MMAFNDYFLPGYITDALKKAGKLRVTESPWENDSLIVRHLEVDPDVLRIAGRELRKRRNELFKDVDWRDQQARRGQLSGLSRLLAAMDRPDAPIQQEALQVLPAISGFSPELIRILLTAFAQLGSQEWGLTDETLPPNQAAWQFVATANGYARYYPGPLGLSVPGLLAIHPSYHQQPVLPLPVMGMPALVSNIAAGNAPGIAIMETLLSTLVGAASLGKNASAEPYFGPRFFQELAGLEEQAGLFPLSDLAVLLTFKGEDQSLMTELIHQGDHLQVTGGLDSKRDIGYTIRRLRGRSLRDLKRRVSGHWHKVSFDLVANDYLQPQWLDDVAFNVAMDNSMFDTQGCLSAQQVFVEGSEAEVLRFAGRYIEQMKAIMQQLPKGRRPHERLREMYQWYEKQSGTIILTTLRDIQTHPFFVVYDKQAETFAMHNALNRSIVIRRVARLETALARLLGRGEKRDLLQSCGVAVPQERLLGIAETLGRAGVNRIVAVGNIWDLRLGKDSWDGYLPPTDLIAPQWGYWTIISFHDLDQELRRVTTRNKTLLFSAPAAVVST